jgi:hypothetical protein
LEGGSLVILAMMKGKVGWGIVYVNRVQLLL